jgi:hypothetical protein
VTNGVTGGEEDHDGITVIGPDSRILLAEPTQVGECPGSELRLAWDCTVGSASSGAAAKNIISTESIVVDFVIFLKIFIGFTHPNFSYSERPNITLAKMHANLISNQ